MQKLSRLSRVTSERGSQAMTLNFERLISADSHVMEPKDLWWNALGERYGDHTPRLLDEHLGRKGTFFHTGRQVLKVGQTDHEARKIGFQEAGYVPEVRVEFQRKAGIAAEVLNATMMLLIMQGRYNSVVRACASVFNDWLAEFCSYNPQRLAGVAMILMDDVDWAVAELDRVAGRGLKGAIINLMNRLGTIRSGRNHRLNPLHRQELTNGMAVIRLVHHRSHHPKSPRHPLPHRLESRRVVTLSPTQRERYAGAFVGAGRVQLGGQSAPRAAQSLSLLSTVFFDAPAAC